MQCPKFYYIEEYKCRRCPVNCEECEVYSDKVVCLKCVKNFFVFEGKCLQECKNELYEYYNIS